MNGYFALLKLQLINRFADLKPRNLKNALKEKKGRSIAAILGITVLVCYLAGLLIYVEKIILDVLLKVGMPDLILSMAITLTMMSTLIMSFFTIMSSLFLGRDSAFLASLPLHPRTILCAKLTEVWVSETLVSAAILLPACIQYAIRTGAGAGFYLRLIPVWLLVDVIPIALVSLISTVLIRVSALWKHREILTTVFGIGFIVVYMLVMANVGGITGDTASGGDFLQQFMESNSVRIGTMTRMFPPARWAAEGLIGNLGMLGLYVLVSLCAMAAAVWLVGLVYRKLSLLQLETPTGTKARKVSAAQYTSGNAFKACCLRELRTILRVPSYATNILPISFMPLLMVIIMAVTMGRSTKGNEETIQMLMGSLNPALVCAILTAVMAYMSGMNPALSTAVTREGKGHALMMSLPVPGWTIIRAKFAVGFGLGALGVICAGIALAVILPALLLPVLLAVVLCLLFTYSTSCLALIRDIKKPRLDWITEQQAVKQNYGVLISMLVSWAILTVLAILSYFLLSGGMGLWAYAGIIGAILLLLCLGMRARLIRVSNKYYVQG